MKTFAQKRATRGQLMRLGEIGSGAVKKAVDDFGLGREAAQNVYARGGRFVAIIHNAVTDALMKLSVADGHRNEQVASLKGYFSGYRRPGDLADQIRCLKKRFPGMSSRVNQDLFVRINNGRIALPRGAEGWFATPNWAKKPEVFGGTLGSAVEKVLDSIRRARRDSFSNCCSELAGHIRQSDRTRMFWKELSGIQGDPDILIVPAQFGFRHRGKSVRRAVETFLDNEAGLGAFAVGTMLLSHPERLGDRRDLWIACAGDELDVSSSDSEGITIEHVPHLVFTIDRVEFGTSCCDYTDGDYGSASGFLFSM